ncbi:MAG: hypothetical protein HJJLKODD_00494 [Phycisphaerae bacterium]|nr:hypothetical protein [Phycisphaerae bacterium]
MNLTGSLSFLLLLFILSSCFYKKHIRDADWFLLGLKIYLGALIVSYILSGVLHSEWILLLGQLGFIASGTCLVIACFKNVKTEVEHLRCLQCGYILKGISEPRCPECGWRI